MRMEAGPEQPPLPDWVVYLLGDTTALQLVFWAIAIFALIALIVKVWPAIGKFVAIVSATAELPAFIKRTDERIGAIHHEVHFNNGSSVKDATKRIEEGVAGLYERVESLQVAVDKLTASDEQQWNAIRNHDEP